MKIYKTIDELEKDVVDNNLIIDDDIEIHFDLNYSDLNISAWDIKVNNINTNDINARNINTNDINARNIKAWYISALDINANNIYASYISAWDINANNIYAGDISANNIYAGDISANNINAGDINALDINAGDIYYYGVCFAYNDIVCNLIEGRRGNSKHFCLDGEITIKEDEKTKQKQAILKKIEELKQQAENL